MSEATPQRTNREQISPPDDRLESWKQIAAYLNRGVRTVQRWEQTEALPVCRHRHDKRGTVHAFRSELDAWLENRRERRETTSGKKPAEDGWSGAEWAAALGQILLPPGSAHRTARLAALILLGVAAIVAWVRA